MSRRTTLPRSRVDLYDRELGPPQPCRWWLEGRVTDEGLSYITRVGGTTAWWMPDYYRPPTPTQHQAIGTNDTAGWLAHIWEEADLSPVDRAGRRLIDGRAHRKRRVRRRTHLK